MLDVYVVSTALLSTTGVPASMPVVQPTLSGLVFERTPEGIRPIAGATVVGDFSGGNGWGPSATTISDGAGRYLLCGVTDAGLGLFLWVAQAGYREASTPVDSHLLRGSGTFDVQLTRQ